MRKPAFCICKNKDADQLRCNLEADQCLCFATCIEKCVYFLNRKFQASSYPQRLYCPVSVGPGRKPRRPVFSQRGSFVIGEAAVVEFSVGLRVYQSKLCFQSIISQ